MNTTTTAPVREVLEFDLGVRVYPPVRDGGYWRLRWEERRQPRDTTARNQAAAIAKAGDIVERLRRSVPTELGRAKGAHLVAHYLDPSRQPPRVAQWSIRHRDEQTRICTKYILPVIADVPCRDLTRADFQQILDHASTPSVAQHVRRCLTALVGAGIEEGYITSGRDLLRGVRWQGPSAPSEPSDRAITEAEIPAAQSVHDLAAATAAVSGVWWHELQILLVAYSGLRWGEHTALTRAQIDPDRRRIRVDQQIVETRNSLVPTLPKGRRRRITMYPATTPTGADLQSLVDRRLDEIEPGGLLFPAPQAGWLRRSNYARKTWDPAATAVNWPRGGRSWHWTFHSLRHVYATWALHTAHIPIEDLSRLLGHSSTRVTQDIYIHIRDDIYDRFYNATT